MLKFSLILKFAKIIFKTLLSLFRGNFLNWLKKIPELIKDRIVGKLWGTKTSVNTATGQEISENYSLDNNEQWHKTTASRYVEIDEIPEEIRRRAVKSNKVDVTDDLELELASEY